MSSNMSVLIIYTGGTIGMVMDQETQSLVPLNFDIIKEQLPELNRFQVKLESLSFDQPIDSSNMSPDVWKELAGIIHTNYDSFDGFVVLHGTDTMSYTASALSFMLEDLGKPVVFTGSQLPIGMLRTDGRENLITAVEIAAAKENGEPIVPEVALYFENKLYRANRTSKSSAEHFEAFTSYNYDPLATVGVSIRYNRHGIASMPTSPLKLHTKLDSNVAVLHLFPGMSRYVVQQMIHIKGLKGLILLTYGSGNAPTYEWFIEELTNAIEKGICIFNVTQCHRGAVKQGQYETSIALRQLRVGSGRDITVEAAITKMMYLLGRGFSGEALLEAMETPLRGELSL